MKCSIFHEKTARTQYDRYIIIVRKHWNDSNELENDQFQHKTDPIQNDYIWRIFITAVRFQYFCV